MERHFCYGRQLGGGDHCPRNRRWSWRGLRTGGGGKCHCAKQQYSSRQSHAGFPSTDNRSIILAPLLKRQVPSAPLGYPLAHIVCCTARVCCWHKADISRLRPGVCFRGQRGQFLQLTTMSASDPLRTYSLSLGTKPWLPRLSAITGNRHTAGAGG